MSLKNMDGMTVGELKDIAALAANLFGGTNGTNPAIGNYCIVRCRNAGVHAGVVKSADVNHVVLRFSRRIWRWKGAFTLSELANNGLSHNGSRVAEMLPLIVLTASDVAEIIPTSDKARASIQSAPEGAENE